MTTINAALPSTAGTDHHSGWYEITSGSSVTIVQFKQMTVWGGLTNDGTLTIEGQLRVEA